MIAGLSTLVLPRRQLVQTLRNPAHIGVLGIGLSLLACGYTVIYRSNSDLVFHLQNPDGLGLKLFETYQILCLIAISLFVPMLGVQAFSSERERQTLELILTTPQRAGSLILAKVASACCFWTIVLSATAPMLSLAMLFGGVGPDELLWMFAVLLTYLFCSLSIGLWAGITAKTTIRGMIRAYLLCNLLFFSVNLFFSIWINIPSGIYFFTIIKREFFLYPSELPGYELVTLVLIGWLFLSLIPKVLKREPVPARPRNWKPIRMKGKDSQLWSLLGAREESEPIGDDEDPMVVCVRRQFLLQVARRAFDIPSLLWIISALMFLGIVLGLPTTIFFYPQNRFTICLVLIAIFTPMVGAAAVSGERERDTWDILRTTLLTPVQILNAKIRVTCGQALVYVVAYFVPGLALFFPAWMVLSLVIFGLGKNYFQVISIPELSPNLFVPIGVGHLLAIPILVGTTLLSASISVWCSVRFRSTFAALTVSYGFCLLYLILPFTFAIIFANYYEGRYFVIGGRQRNPEIVLKTQISTVYAPALFECYERVFNLPMRIRPRIRAGGMGIERDASLERLNFIATYTVHLLLLVLLSMHFYRLALKRLQRDPQPYPR